MTHPFDIPEITEFVGLFLSSHTLAQCTLVSREWYQAFAPLIWRNCRLPQDLITMGPELFAAWSRFTPVIRQLYTNKEFLCQDQLQGLDLSTLHTLSIDKQIQPNVLFSWRPVLIFLRRHLDRIQSLTLRELPIHRIFGNHALRTRYGIGLVSLGQRLTKLSLIGSTVDFSQWTDPVWVLFNKLDSLSIENCSFEDMDMDVFQKRLEGNRIRHLILVHNQVLPSTLHAQRMWVEACPELRSLRWQNRQGREATEEEPAAAFAKHLALGHWQSLTSLDLCFRRIQDHEIAEILAALHCGLWSLKLDVTGFGPNAKDALLYKVVRPGWRQVPTKEPSIHRETLEQLSVRRTSQMYASTIQDFLCLLKNLKGFHASVDLTDQAVESDTRPWGCLHLITLELKFALKVQKVRPISPSLTTPGSSPSPLLLKEPISTLLMDRLATLTRLEALVVGDRGRPAHGTLYVEGKRHQSQSFRLRDGLDRLKTLTRLRKIQFGHSGQSLSVDEARWMIQHWPRLERIDVKDMIHSTTSPFKNWKEAWAIFKDHGIKNELSIQYE